MPARIDLSIAVRRVASIVGLGLAAGVVSFAIDQPSRRVPPPTPTEPARVIPLLGFERPYAQIVDAAPERAVPDDVLASADSRAAPWAPGLALVAVTASTTWEHRRAEIRDLTDEDVRAYAIGDLLPHGSVLVGIDAGAAEVWVGDREIIRLSVGGGLVRVEDFATATAVFVAAKDLSEPYKDAVADAVDRLRFAESDMLQALVDELIACGDPAVELLIDHVDDLEPVPVGRLGFPSGGKMRSPRVVGDVVVGVLEVITGQTFGDPMSSDADARARIASAWRRWWG